MSAVRKGGTAGASSEMSRPPAHRRRTKTAQPQEPGTALVPIETAAQLPEMTAIAVMGQRQQKELQTKVEGLYRTQDAAGFKAFVLRGLALGYLRDSKLHALTHRTWEEYVRDRFDISKTYANDLIASARTAVTLAQDPYGAVVRNEYQARQLRGNEWQVTKLVQQGTPPHEAIQLVIDSLLRERSDDHEIDQERKQERRELDSAGRTSGRRQRRPGGGRPAADPDPEPENEPEPLDDEGFTILRDRSGRVRMGGVPSRTQPGGLLVGRKLPERVVNGIVARDVGDADPEPDQDLGREPAADGYEVMAKGSGQAKLRYPEDFRGMFRSDDARSRDGGIVAVRVAVKDNAPDLRQSLAALMNTLAQMEVDAARELLKPHEPLLLRLLKVEEA